MSTAAARPPLAHFAKGQVLRAQRLYAEAIPEYETVLAADRNWVYAFFALGQCKFNTGSIEEAIPLIERAIRLSPRDPQLGVWYEMTGLVYLYQSRADEAVAWLEKARNHTPAHSMIRGDLAAAYGFAGETGIARLPQVRYTYPMANGWSAAAAVENPDPQSVGPFGQYDFDSAMIPTAASCTALTAPALTTATGLAAVAGTTPASTLSTNITNACLGNAAFFNALQPIMPTLVGRLRVDQPWGHLQFGVVGEGYGMNDGRGLNKQYLGYGGSVSAHFFTWGKDNIGGGLAAGNGTGGVHVEVKKADGLKCERCWNYSTRVGEDKAYPTVCERCSAALKELEAAK